MADDDVRQAYWEHMGSTADGIFSKCFREPFLRWRPVRIYPLLINPWEKKNRPVSHTHAANYLGSPGSPQGVVKISLLGLDPIKCALQS